MVRALLVGRGGGNPFGLSSRFGRRKWEYSLEKGCVRIIILCAFRWLARSDPGRLRKPRQAPAGFKFPPIGAKKKDIIEIIKYFEFD